MWKNLVWLDVCKESSERVCICFQVILDRCGDAPHDKIKEDGGGDRRETGKQVTQEQRGGVL